MKTEKKNQSSLRPTCPKDWTIKTVVKDGNFVTRVEAPYCDGIYVLGSRCFDIKDLKNKNVDIKKTFRLTSGQCWEI